MTKKTVLGIFSLLLIFIFAISALATSSTSPQIVVTLLSQTPDPVEPGEIVTVKFKIENTGASSTVDNLVKILPKYPLSVYNDVAEKNIGKLRAGQDGADAAIVEFKIKVDEQAVGKKTEIELQVRASEDTWVSFTDDELLIDVKTNDVVLDISSIKTTPSQVPPGETGRVDIVVRNVADSLMRDIKFDFDFSGTIPLAPYQSSSERKISLLKSNSQKTISLNVIADPKAEAGLYKVPVNITFFDEQGKSYRVEDLLALTIGDAPKLRTYVKKSTVLQSGKEGKVTVEIANAGSTNIKFLEFTLLPSDDYQLITTSKYFYIGDLDSDDTESEEINIFVTSESDKVSIPLQLKYTDANNKPFQQNVDLKMDIYSSSQLKKFGVIKSSNVGIFVVILILAVGGFIWYRKRKTTGKKK